MIYDLDDFFGGLAMTTIDLFPMDARAMGQAGSSLRPVQVGYRLWSGQVTVAPAPHASARQVEAKLMRLTEADAMFFLTPPHAQKQKATGTLSTISSSDRRIVTLSGVSVSAGDFIGFKTGSIYSLHSVSDVVGSSVQVVPPLPLSITSGSVATTDKPKMTAVAMPGVTGRAYQAVISGAFSFGFSQTLGAAQ